MKIIQILILLGLVFINQYSIAGDDKYQKLLFPDGMPLEENWDGQKREMLYDFYSETSISGQKNLLILYSTKSVTGASDDLFTVYFSYVVKRGNKLSVVATEDITNYITTFTEIPGNFYQMDGIIETFKIDDINLGIHVNLWAVISGSGSISSSTDLFYSIKPDKKLNLLLALKKTSSFSRTLKTKYESKNDFLYYGDLDANGTIEVISIKSEYKVDISKNIYDFSLSPLVETYKFTNDSFAFSGNINIFKEDIPGLKEFKKSRKIIYPEIPSVFKKIFNDVKGKR